MKGKFLLSVFAVILPVSLAGQVAKPKAADTSNGFDRYEVFAGADYSSANQVKGSSALIGFNIGGSAKLNRWFGATGDFGYYANSSGVAKPTVTTFLAGPEFSVSQDKLMGFAHIMFGGAHTGGVGAQPDVSFAFAPGGGFEYLMTQKLALRLSGDAIYSSFVLDPTNQGFSAHMRVNGRASGGVSYRF